MEETKRKAELVPLSERVNTGEVAVLGEDKERREAAVKHFALKNGAGMAIVYPYTVHYENNGEWKDINNDLRAEKDVLRNTDSDFGIELPRILGKEGRIRVTNKGYSLAFHPDQADETEIKIIDREKPDSENARKTQTRAVSRAVYPGAIRGGDLEYALIGQSLKEEIRIPTPEQAAEEYSVTLWAEGLTPKLHEDGRIQFDAKDGDMVFCLPAPYLHDSSIYTGTVKTELRELSAGKYQLIYRPDTEWFRREELVWPVTLDPTISKMYSTSADIDDTFASSKNPSAVYNSADNMILGYVNSYYYSQAYIKLKTLPQLSNSDTVIDATLRIYADRSNDYPSGHIHNLRTDVHMVTEAGTVDYSALCWSNRPAVSADVLDFQIMNNNVPGDQSAGNNYYFYNITRAVRAWYAGTTVNNGLAFITNAETTYPTVNWYYMYATESGYTDKRPVLTVFYRNTSGLEDCWDYTSQSIGQAGTVSVQNFTGNLVVNRTDMSYGGNLMPAAIGFTYNLSDKNTDIGYGYGWRNSYSQTVALDSATQYYCWIDGDGTRIYFAQSDGVWKDEMGSGFTLTVENNGYTIEDKQENVMVFDSIGRLTEIRDKLSNTLAVAYAYSTGSRISQVTDGAGRKYAFIYTNNRVSRVSYKGTGDTVIQKAEYTYDGNGCLTEVTYTRYGGEGGTITESIQYQWSARRMTKALDVERSSGREEVGIGHNSGSGSRPGTVSALQYTAGGTIVSRLGFTYGDNTTRVHDRLGRWIIYQFNNYGNTTAVYNSRGQALYGRWAQDSDENNRANQLSASSRLQDTDVSNTAQITASVTADGVTETLTLDGRVNLLANGDLTTDLSSWTGEHTSSPDGWGEQEDSRGKLEKHAVHVFGDPMQTKRYYQEKTFTNGAQGDILTFGGWIKAISAALDNTHAFRDPSSGSFIPCTRRAGLLLELFNGSEKVCEKYVPMNEDVQFWQFLSGDLQATGAYTKAVYSFVYDYNSNDAWFDGAQLFQEAFEYLYTYDDDGKLIKITDLDGNETEYTYVTGKSDISSIKLPGGGEYHYSYNIHGLLWKSVTPSGVQTTYNYDSHGNTARTVVGTGDRTIQTHTTYTDDGNMTATHTNDSRNKVFYTNDTERSLVTSFKDTLQNITDYTYDSKHRLVETSQGSSAVTNAYTDERLTGISHTDDASRSTGYGMEYDGKGFLTAVKVGGNTLTSNTYRTNYWTLARQNYGNGHYWSYGYSNYSELQSKYNNTGFGYRYFYNTRGQLAKLVTYDVIVSGGEIAWGTTPRTIESYLYDAKDRLVRVVLTNGVGLLISDISWSLDYDGAVTSKSCRYAIEGTVISKSQTFVTDDDKRPTQTAYSALCESLTYDGESRLSGKTVTWSGANRLTTSYTYRNVGTLYTTRQISVLTNTFNGNTLQHSYSYDYNGNITADGTTLYQYDSQNQLLWEKNAAAGLAWQYTYDAGGNILTKTRYGYTGGSLSPQPQQVCSYSYTNSAWGDQLTSYDGQTITYDAIGNPLSYRGATLTWQAGRQLKTLTNSGTTLSFVYNEAGLRTGKTVVTADGTVTHRYLWDGGKLLADIYGTSARTFRYNGLGEMIGFALRDGAQELEYLFVKNQQGDVERVIRLHDQAVVASYTYDAWGNVLSQSGPMANANPIRYRSYYYDRESGLYYLKSRYYDPVVGRFISADDASNLGANSDFASLNLYAYCGNNPVSRKDNGGLLWNTIIGAVVGGIMSIVTRDDNETIGQAFVRGFVIGGVQGLALDICIATGGVGGVVLCAGMSAASGFFDSIWTDCHSGRSINWVKAGVEGVISGGLGILFGEAGRVAKREIGKTVKTVCKAVLKNSVQAATSRSGKFLLSKFATNLGLGLFNSATQSGFAYLFTEALLL